MSEHMLMKGMPVKDLSKLPYPLWGEAKYDECRCRVWLDLSVHPAVVRFDSYAGKTLHNLAHEFGVEFKGFMVGTGICELDMGIEVNGNFNDSYRWVRSSSGWPKESIDKKTGKVSPSLSDADVKFYLFDLPLSESPFDVRLAERGEAVYALLAWHLNVEVPEGEQLNSPEAVDAWFKRCRESGHEGAMLKSLTHLYRRGKHTGSWWKLKPSAEADGKIVGFTEAVSKEGVPLGRVGSVDVVCEDGSKASPAGFEHGLAKLIWENPLDYLGDWLEFGYMERDRQGGYRHPHFSRFREAK